MPDDPGRLRVAQPQRFVAVLFWGAATPSRSGPTTAGNLVAEDSELAEPNVHDRRFRVAVDAGTATITRVTFGYEKAETAVTAITFGVAADDENVVRFDQELSEG